MSFETSVEVTGIRIRRLVVPLRRELATRIGTFNKGPFLAIDLELKGGGTARVLGFTFSRIGLTVVPPILEALTAFAKGRSLTLRDLPSFHDACAHHLQLLGLEGVTQLGRSMFDMALYDAIARAEGVPLYKLLGGHADPVQTYNSTGLGLLSPEAAAAEARQLAAADGGYAHIKMRLGRAEIAEDLAALHAVRAAIGTDVALSVDFNQGLEAASAIDTCRAIDDFGLAWIEEPVPYDDYPAQARLARKLKTDIQIGESWWSWRVGKMAIDLGAADQVMPDILRIGGVTGWMRLAEVAKQTATPFSSHLSPDYSVHLMSATPTGRWLEFMDWGHDVLDDPLTPMGGFARPAERPGAGMEWNEAALTSYEVQA